MPYPLLPAAIAAERIADMHRQAARRSAVLSALRARRQRRRDARLYDTPALPGPRHPHDPPLTETAAPHLQPQEGSR